MGFAEEKVAELLTLPREDRALLARRLLASLDETVDADSEAEADWLEAIDRRSSEIEGKVSCRPVDEVVQEIRKKLRARRRSS